MSDEIPEAAAPRAVAPSEAAEEPSALFVAAYRGNLAEMRRLIAEGADVNAATADGSTPLHAACQEARTEAVRLLISSGARVDPRQWDGMTPLLVACELGHALCARDLILAKANVDASERRHGATALHLACRGDHADCVAELMAGGSDRAQADTEPYDADGATPLVVAAYHGHARCAGLLLQYQAMADVRYYRKRLIHWTRKMGHIDVTRMLERALGDAAAPSGSDDDDDDDDDDGWHDVAAEAKEAEAEAAKAEAEAAEASAEAKVVVGIGAKAEARPDDRAAAGGLGEFFSKVTAEAGRRGIGGEGLVQMEHMRDALSAAAGPVGPRPPPPKMPPAPDALARAISPELPLDERPEPKLELLPEQEPPAEAPPTTAASARERANALFGKGKVSEAAAAYAHAIELCGGGAAIEAAASAALAHPAGGSRAPCMLAALHANLAACELKRGKFEAAAAACDIAVRLEPAYTKALFRRAQAARALRRWDAALADARAALAAADADADAADAAVSGGGAAARALAKEASALVSEVEGERERRAADESRAKLEREGITLSVEESGSEGGGGGGGVYYASFANGERVQDFMWWARRELRAKLLSVRHVVEAEKAAVVVTGLEGEIDGHVSIRRDGGRRALYYELEMTVEWRGTLEADDGHVHTLDGACRLWNIGHAVHEREWKHDNRRQLTPAGPYQDEIAGRYAPFISPLLRLAVSEVIGELIVSKADASAVHAAFGSAARPGTTTKEKHRASIDYSRWDDLDVSSDDEYHGDRVVEMVSE